MGGPQDPQFQVVEGHEPLTGVGSVSLSDWPIKMTLSSSTPAVGRTLIEIVLQFYFVLLIPYSCEEL